ncbi:serine/threonine protein kinase [Prosthecobacter fusiformis]|uniref:Serine/threonine protein kinase n=1 Tax=Prosthecobacter fusiformis TaxID=48464 RepID=A0A4R7RZY3_9BACT|nr:protein kinase [Prosthecobacter fusiformis]TDU70726.1 serine/threonine protein kinase [Prosthecobacter fusiformis]
MNIKAEYTNLAKALSEQQGTAVTSKQTGQGIRTHIPDKQQVTRAAQTHIIQCFTSKKLAARGITVANVISREGMKATLGKAGVLANIKDGLTRLKYRLSHSNQKASSELGNSHRVLIRLAGQYHTLATNPTPQNKSAREQLLEKLDTKLKDLQGSLDMSNSPAERRKYVDVRLMKDYITEEKRLLHNEVHQDGLEIPQAPPNPLQNQPLNPQGNQGEGIQFKANGLTRGDFQNTRDTLKPTGNNTENRVQENLEQAPEVPEGSGPSEYKPKAPLKFTVATKGDTLEQVKKNLTEPVKGTVVKDGFSSASNIVGKNSLKDLEVALAHSTQPKPRGESKPINDPSIKDLSGFSFQSQEYGQLRDQMKAAVKNEPSAQPTVVIGKSLGQLLIQEMNNLGEQDKKNFMLALTTTRSAAWMDDILQDVGNAFPERFRDQFTSLTLPSNKQMKEILEAAFDELLTALPNTSEQNGNLIILNGVQYQFEAQLGEGGLGIVSTYRKVPNQIGVEPEVIAIKKSKDDDLGFDQLAKEVRNHAQVGEHPNVPTFRGAVRSPNGELFIAMDLAPRGDMMKLAGKIQDAVSSGLISQTTANVIRLTLMQDVIKGLHHLQEQVGMVHVDLKMQNFFIQNDGVAQIGDFGISQTSLDSTVEDTKLDADYNKAPEILIQGGRQKTREGAIVNTPENKPFREAEVSENLIKLNEKVDVFALGTAVYELFSGQSFLGDLAGGHDWYREYMALREYGLDPSRTVSTLGTDGKGNVMGTDGKSNVMGTGATALDRVLNAMLSPDPEKRPSMSELMNYSLFKQTGVGEVGVRDLIKLLTTPGVDPQDLKQANANLGL